MERPVGVTILAVLGIVLGAFAIIGGIVSALGAAAVAAIGAGALAAGGRGAGFAAASVVVLVVLGIWFVIVGGLDIVFGIGALRLRPWAWTLGVILMIISVASNILQVFAAHGNFFGVIISVAISGFILYYLLTPDVKAAFGKTGVGPDMPALGGQPSYRPPAQQQYQPPAQQPYGAPPAQQPPAQPYGAPPAQQPPAPPAEPPANPPAQPPAPPA